MLLRYSFESVSTSLALGTANSVLTVDLSKDRCWHSKNIV